MSIAQSKLTAQGQISVPAEIRKRLGLGPGSVLEWEEKDGEIVVRRAGRLSTSDIHKTLFPKGAPTRASDRDLKKGIAKHMRKKHARS